MKHVVLALALVSGCGSSLRSGESLAESVRTYNESVRWGRLQLAASRLPAHARAEFVDTWDELSEDLRISDYEIVKVAQQRVRASVHVKYTWYLDSRGTVHETHAEQRWEPSGKAWVKVDEWRLRGETMPGLADDPVDAADRAPARDRGPAPAAAPDAPVAQVEPGTAASTW